MKGARGALLSKPVSAFLLGLHMPPGSRCRQRLTRPIIWAALSGQVLNSGILICRGIYGVPSLHDRLHSPAVDSGKKRATHHHPDTAKESGGGGVVAARSGARARMASFNQWISGRRSRAGDGKSKF
jgi:hypothetical protein